MQGKHASFAMIFPLFLTKAFKEDGFYHLKKKNYSYIPIIILLVSDAFYHTADIFWISGLGTSAIVSIGYIANFLYIIDKIGDGIGRLLMF